MKHAQQQQNPRLRAHQGPGPKRALASSAAFLAVVIAACGSDETGSTSGGGDGGAGTGGQMACTPGEKQACYTGPVVSQGVGTCKGGERTCNAEGTGFGVCEGQVTPADDDCATPEDEDCDGTPAPPCAGTAAFGVRLGGAGNEIGSSVAFDPSGAMIVAGSFEASVDFGGGPLMSAGGKDVFVAKLDASGKHVLSKGFGDAMGDQAAASVAVGKDGSVVVAGWFASSIDFGAGALMSAGGKDVFVAKLDGAGAVLWAKAFGGAGGEEAFSAAVDSAGDVYVTGVFDGSFTAGAATLTSAGATDVFVLKLASATGEPAWAKSFGDPKAQIGRSVAVDSAGNVVVAGGFDGAVDFGGGLLVTTNALDGFVAKLDPSGAHVSSARYGGGLDQVIQGVAADPSGGVVIAGSFQGQVDLGGGALQSAGLEDIFVGKLDALGAHVFSKAFGDASAQFVESVAVGADGSIALTGRFMGSLDLGHKPPLPGTDAFDIFVGKLDASGAYVWGHAYGGTFDQIGLGVAVDGAGSTALTGTYLGSLDVAGEKLTSAGLRDAFLVKFAP